jgi:tripartite-type tricarboxylate transporter receptor subunit TctC
LVLDVHPKMGIKTVKELVALAKRPDSKLTFASAGNGTPQHLAGEIFNTQMGISMSHIPYRGAGPALNDMIGGQVSAMFDVLGSSLPHIQVGRLVPLAVTSAKRHPSLPDVPTMMEAGIEGYEFTAWHGIAVRSGTPVAAITKLNTTLNAIFNDTEFKKKWEAIGTPVVGGTPQQFAEVIRKDSIRLGEVVKRAGVTVD